MAESNPQSKKEKLDEMSQRLATKFSGVPNISPKGAVNLQQEGKPIVFVDTRTAEEQAVSRIPGSLTTAEFEARENEFKEMNAHVINYCTVGYRSSQYAQKLKERGFENAANLEGSILAWTHEGLPLVVKNGDTETETNKVHVFSDSWALQADGYEPVVFKRGMLSYGKSLVSSFFTKLFK